MLNPTASPPPTALARIRKERRVHSGLEIMIIALRECDARANSVLTESEFALFLFEWLHFLRAEPASTRGSKSAGMLRRKML